MPFFFIKKGKSKEDHLTEFVIKSVMDSKGLPKKEAENKSKEELNNLLLRLQEEEKKRLTTIEQIWEYEGIDFEMQHSMVRAGKKLGKQLSQQKENIYLISFTQAKYIRLLDSLKYPKLERIAHKFTGLCEIICNYVTANNLLDKEFNDNKTEEVADELESEFSMTHIIQNSSTIQLLLAMIFHVYPNSLLTRRENINIFKNQTLNKDIFLNALKNLGVDEDAKFCAFNKSIGVTLHDGHSMLIRKHAEDEYIFFDPNQGVTAPLTKEKLYAHISQWLKDNPGYNEICLMNNTKYINHIHKAALNPQPAKYKKLA